MKKILLLILLSIIVLVSISCTNSTNSTFPTSTTDFTNDIVNSDNAKTNDIISTNENGEVKDIEIGWDFETSTKTDENGSEVPTTKVALVINNKKEQIGAYLGYPQEVIDFEGSNLPKDTILACKTWFGGAGVDIYIIKSNDTTLEVMWNTVDESDGTQQKYEKVKDIIIPEKANIKINKTKISP